MNKCNRRDHPDNIRQCIFDLLGNFPILFLPDLELEDDEEAERNIDIISQTLQPRLIQFIDQLKASQLRKMGILKLDRDHIRELKEEARRQKLEHEEKMKAIQKEQVELRECNLKQTKELGTLNSRLSQALHAQSLLLQNQTHDPQRRGYEISLGPLKMRF